MTTGAPSGGSPSLLSTLVAHARLSLRLLREPAVPLVPKLLPVGALLYVVFPLDFVPDLIPILGQLDDASVVLLALGAFLRLCPQPAVMYHTAELQAGRPYAPMPPAGIVIDAEFRREPR